tara:strand:+ start:1141 stop:1917 length:777 start_codon:yes stop_codon:yes gene_type:complete
MSTDNDWEKWGATDPYFGVLSSEKFRKNKLNESIKKEFFETGIAHVERVFQLIHDNFNQECKPKRALDFGCGVGRLALPFADRTDQTVGVDISKSMLSEALSNARSAGISNVEFVLSDDGFTRLKGEFDLVHSYIVLQHIPWSRGRKILQQLADRVSPGGYLAVNLFSYSNVSGSVRAAVRLRYLIPPLNWLRNILKRRPIFEPAMQLHIYDIDKVMSDLKERGFDEPICCNEAGIDEFEGVFLLAQRKRTSSTIKNS